MTEEEPRQGDEGGDLDNTCSLRSGRGNELHGQDFEDVCFRVVGRDFKNEQDAHDNAMGRSGQEGRHWKNIRQKQIGGARFQTET